MQLQIRQESGAGELERESRLILYTSLVQQAICNLPDNAGGHRLYFRTGLACQRVFEHNEREFIHAKHARPDMSRHLKGRRNQCNRRSSQFLDFARVVETPRYAGASIRDAVHEGVA